MTANDTDSDTLAYQQLQPEDILDAVEAQGWRTSGQLLALNSYENRVYRVGLEDGDPLVVKFYRPGRWSDRAIREELEFADKLAAEDIPVVAPLHHDNGPLQHHGPFRFAVFPCHGGRAPELDDLHQLRQIGRLVARIHNVGERREFGHRPGLDLAGFGEASRDFLLQHGFLPLELETVYDGLCDHLFDAVEACYERAGATRQLRLHGDFHPGNVLVRDHRFHIVDLDDCRSGPAVQDLWMFLSGNRQEQTPQLDALLEGYQAFRDFDARQLHLVEALRTLRIVHYAAWLARRWQDPAFQLAFPWFDSPRYWDDHILALREQAALMESQPLSWSGP